MNKVKHCLLLAAIASSQTSVAEDQNFQQKQRKAHSNFSFAVIADAPYGDQNVPAFDNLIKDINADKSVRFVMHGGDIKSGGTECSDERLSARFKQYQSFDKPFIFTPGDNEWTDCHRENNGQYNPLERLNYLRDLFYPEPGYTTGGKKMRIKTQADSEGYSKFVENALFHKSGVVFSAIHVVGSNNNLRPWSGIDTDDSFENPREDRLAEFQQRERASIEWLKATFEKAHSKNAKGVFILIHANPQFSVNYTDEGRAGFNGFLNELFVQAKNFAKPVVLAHGDSHIFFSDKPKLVPWYADGSTLTASDEPEYIPNLSRFQTFGDSPQHWVKVTIDPNNKDLFLIEPQVVKANLN